MSADTLLSKLDKVKRTRPGNWLACCPAHDDRGPSLSIRELDDGATLIHCFAGCAPHEILNAVGLEMADLFPPREPGKHFSKGDRRPFPAADILRAVAFEALVVAVAGSSLLAGEPLDAVDRDRLFLAVGRIQAALEAGGLNHG